MHGCLVTDCEDNLGLGIGQEQLSEVRCGRQVKRCLVIVHQKAPVDRPIEACVCLDGRPMIAMAVDESEHL